MTDEGGTLLWSIGDASGWGDQFSDRWFSAPDWREPVFVVGQSDPDQDWPRIHPGPWDPNSGFRSWSATVEFELDELWPAECYELLLDGLAERGPCPDLAVEVNGQKGMILLRPRRDGEQPVSLYLPGPIAARVTRRVALPAAALRLGVNRIVLTTVGRHSTASLDELPDDYEWPRRPSSAWHWLRLALCRNGGSPPAPSIVVEPLPLYIDDGGVRELVDVLVLGAPVVGDLRGTLTWDGARLPLVDVAESPRFGDVCVRVAVPEREGMVPIAVVFDGLDGLLPALDTHARAARKWTVHLLPHMHLDVGFTDRQAKVFELHSRNLETALDLLDADSSYAFSIDGSVVVEEFLRSRSRAQAKRALDALVGERIAVNGFWALLLSGVASLEELYRASYFTAALRRDHGVPVTYANLTDVPSYPWAVPSVLAAAGIDGFMGIANHARGGNAESDVLHLRSPVCWVGPDGKSTLASFADHYQQLMLIAGHPPSVAGAASGLCRFLARYERPDYQPRDIPVMASLGDNDDLAFGYADFVRRWNSRYVWPRLRFSTIGGYLDAVRPLRNGLPVVRGDGGSYWEDGVGSQARPVAMYRRTQALLPAAETLAALVAVGAAELRPNVERLDEAWACQLIGCEHTWTSAHGTSRPASSESTDQLAWKVARIERAHRIAADTAQQALSQLAARTSIREVPAVVVFNPASWTRDLFAEVELEDQQVLTAPDGELIEMDARLPARDGVQTCRIRVKDVAPFGYRVLALQRQGGLAAGAEPCRTVSDLDTPHYEATVDPGTGQIVQLYHRTLGRQLLDTSQWPLGQLLYVSGGGTETGRGLTRQELTTIYENDPGLPEPALEIVPAVMHPVELRRTPWGWVLVSEGHAPNCPQVRNEVELYDHTDVVDVTVSIEKKPTLAKESVYVTFPFAIDHPTLCYDRQVGWVDPNVDSQPGACTEWFAMQHAVVLRASNWGITWSSVDAPLFTLGDVVRSRWPSRFQPSNGTLFSWVMNNYWRTNTPASQGGSMAAHYSFRPDRRHDVAAAGRFGRQARTPPLVGRIIPNDRRRRREGGLPDDGTLLSGHFPDNVVVTVYPSRRGDGLVVRAQEIGGHTAEAAINHPWSMQTAWAERRTAVEDYVQDIPIEKDGNVRLTLSPYEVVTVALGPKPSAP